MTPPEFDDELVDGEWTKLYHPPTMSPWMTRRPAPPPDSDPLGFGYHRHSDADSSTSRNRTSILSAASDVLGLRRKIGSVSRKKQQPLIVPGVIEINACNVTSTIGGTTAHIDCEHEERERLRDVAAQSIGLGPEILHTRSFFESPPQPPSIIPPFPATLATLYPYTELSATLPKFTPPTSLLVYALSKQWKPRTIVLTLHSPNHKAHVHLFKSASKDEKELERLEVTEDSVIFVAEEEVGGRGHVVKLAGKDMAPKRTGQEHSRTMWLLQIKDPAESHRWITAIKNAVLTQRAMRAGLDVPAQSDGGNEPKGDMDVMLSMHLQRTILTHPPNVVPTPSPASPSPTPSLRSLRIAIPSSPSPKGIFSGTRSRSPSVEGSPVLTHPPGHTEESFGAAGTSLLTMLRNKPSTDSGSPPSTLPHVSGRGSPTPSLRSAHTPVIITASDLKISRERDAPEPSAVVPEASSSSSTPGSNTPPAPSFSPPDPSQFSLQPPPRKYKHAVAITPATMSHEPLGMYKQANGNCSVAGNFGISSRDLGSMSPTPPISPDSSSFSGGHSGSLSPNSGFASPYFRDQNDDVMRTQLGNSIINALSFGSGFVPTDKLPQSTAVTKRWSRQGIPLPKQLTPPSRPPPSIPLAPEDNHRASVESSASIPITCSSPGSSSSHFHTQPRISSKSGPPLSPTFWKRASACSTYSASSTSTSESHIRYQLRVPFCVESVPPSNGPPSRPMSMSVHGSSPVVHVGKAKRRSMPPPRPAPNFAPPPAPTIQEYPSEAASPITPAPAPQKSFRNSVAQRAMRLSLTSPKPPPLSALPPRPDEITSVQGHRRSSSTGTSDLHSSSAPSSRPPSSLSKTPPIPTSPPRPLNLSLRQRLRILSTPPASPRSVHTPSSIPSIQISTLDLTDDNDNDDDLPTPYPSSAQTFGLGEHITAVRHEHDPGFFVSPKPPPPRSPFRAASLSSSGTEGLRTLPIEPDCDFVALSPPPPRRGSKPRVVRDVVPVESAQRDESRLSVLSQRGSVVSLGFVTT